MTSSGVRGRVPEITSRSSPLSTVAPKALQAVMVAFVSRETKGASTFDTPSDKAAARIAL